jgi:hypothetical protein
MKSKIDYEPTEMEVGEKRGRKVSKKPRAVKVVSNDNDVRDVVYVMRLMSAKDASRVISLYKKYHKADKKAGDAAQIFEGEGGGDGE